MCGRALGGRAHASAARTSRSWAWIQASVSARIVRGSRARAPRRALEQAPAVRRVERHVARARVGDRLDRDLVAGQLAAQVGRLAQRQRAGDAAADVERLPVPALGVGELLEHEVAEVVDVQQVAHLLAAAAVADVGQRPLLHVREQPVREHALVDLAHLPRPGDHAEAVDRRGHAERVGVLGEQQLGGELRGAVERARSRQREVLGDPVLGRARHRLLGLEREARLLLAQREPQLRRDGIDAAGGEEDDVGAVAARELEAVVRADEVRLHDEVGARAHAGQHRRLRRALDDRLHLADRGEVVALAHVAVHEAHAGLAQPREVELGAAPLERVERDHLGLGALLGEREAEVRPDEAGAARHEDPAGELARHPR